MTDLLTPSVPERLVARAADWLSRRVSRRGFLLRAAVTGSALAVDPFGYILKPGTAYASVCGDGSTCSSGWTAFCCTINRGVNACPPGTLAAGWWKADGASLCGGSARYIVDCNVRCTCTAGCGSFCSSGCRTMSCHCAPGTTCDQRRVACNVFRYGQCNQQVGCVGPVACRVVSCTPPYRFERCSTSAATDNRTRTHNAPCNPIAWTANTARYRALGSQGSVLGTTVGAEAAVTGGSRLRCTRGALYASNSISPKYVVTPIHARYVALGETAGSVGFPTSDTTPTHDGVGRFNHFVGASIWSHPRVGTFVVRGTIRAKYAALRYAAGPLWYPTTDTLTTRDGTASYNRFQRGTIVARGALVVAVLGAIEARWRALGAETGRLGYPVSDQRAVTGGVRSDFQGGYIRLDSATGEVAVVFKARGGPS